MLSVQLRVVVLDGAHFDARKLADADLKSLHLLVGGDRQNDGVYAAVEAGSYDFEFFVQRQVMVVMVQLSVQGSKVVFLLALCELGPFKESLQCRLVEGHL